MVESTGIERLDEYSTVCAATAIGSEGCLGIEGGGSKSSAAPATNRRRLCTADGGPVSARHFAGDRWCRGSPPTYRVADTISDAQT